MNNLASLIILFTIGFICTTILIRSLFKPLSNLGMIDIPGNRRAHATATPRGGGLAISSVILSVGPLFEYITTDALTYSMQVIPSFFLITLVSFLDDIKTIPVFIRFITHLSCASTVTYFMLYPLQLFHNELPYVVDFILAIVGLTAFLNIYNFLDGIDGLTAVETIHLTITMLILCFLKSDIIINLYFIVTVSVLICSCSASFLIFNWSPARIFLGDVGSISLGFLIGLCLLLIAASSERLFVSAIIASLYYLTDGGLTILIRLINREKIWQPHLKHFFQQAVRNGMTHKQVVKKIVQCNFVLMILSISALFSPVVSTILAVMIVTLTLIKFSR